MTILHLIRTLMLPVLLTGCGTFSGNPQRKMETAQKELNGATLKDAKMLLFRAQIQPSETNFNAVYRLRAAEIAWENLANSRDPNSYSQAAPALDVLARAQEELAPLFVGDQPATRTFSYADKTYILHVAPAGPRGIYDPKAFQSIKSLEHVKHGLCKRCITEKGAGAAYCVRWKVPSGGPLKPFLSSRGYFQPVSSTLNFGNAIPASPRHATLTFHDATTPQKVTIGRSTFPLAADFTSPIEDVAGDIHETFLGLQGVFNPRQQDAELKMLEPYDPQRIPVVFVHGLLSHPRMWRDVLNELRADPALRGRFQYWSFRYPTGWPTLYSAMRLRTELTSIYKTLDPQPPPMILVGHSMGGLISHLQAVNPQRSIWDAELGNDADRKMRTLPADHLSKSMMIFEPTPHVSRLVFICVPHRGSKIASWSVVSALSSLIRLPTYLLRAATDFPNTIAKGSRFNGVARLSEKNPTFRALDALKITVPFQSIIGDRGKGDSPKSSDGAVEYWSSHLEGAASELIVPASHTAYDHPLSIQEMRRILLVHLASLQANSKHR